MKVPGGANVDRALVTLEKSMKSCLRDVNHQAGMLVAKGDYARAESLVEIAKSVDALRVQVESLHRSWREIRRVRGGPTGGRGTPLWEYYQPILEALVDLGGTARIGELQSAVNQLMDGRFVEGDLRVMAGGRPRWHVMIRRARKHMVREGFLEEDSGLEWRITPVGRKAADPGRSKKE